MCSFAGLILSLLLDRSTCSRYRVANRFSLRMTISQKMAPAFSPDGSRIAYTATDASFGWNTWVVSVLGAESQATLPNAAALTWIDRGQVLFSEIKSRRHCCRKPRRRARRPRAGQRRQNGPPLRVVSNRMWVLVSEMDKTGWMPCRVVPFDGSSGGEVAGPRPGGCTYAGWSPDGS